MKKGLNKERDLVNYLNFLGYSAVRIAGSGAGTKKPRPDILAGNGYNIYGIELKSSSRDNIYINSDQVKNLVKFCDNFGAVPVIAIKFTYLPYAFMSITDLNCTNKGNYIINRNKAKYFKNKIINNNNN